MTVQTRRPFNGRHMTAILVAGFGVVVAVNVTMATLASTTFGGIVVENSYVASQDFNRWLDEAAKEKALGWTLDARRGAGGRVMVDLQVGPAEAPAVHTRLTAVARHPLGRLPDTALTFRHEGGHWISDGPLPAGRWTLRFDAEADGRQWRTEREIGA
ncbi:FixH family protein [Novosphingobium guangzhouense]|uniref:Nitrogen fixation protein FixH n=1 Tax=Novosphingobium guangzhouense TaxID=1850347 RepID=A0A2K2FYL1_9SPHN|nr:FixH family protein [Novosphingobium guangzhouense]PNU03860.1 hypothetical protein A8V01_22155 [Novosphingobium guangzhouense]